MNIDQMIIDGNRRLLKTDGELLISACEITNARRMVEVGSFDGGSTNILGTYAKENNGMLWCVEPYPTAKWKANLSKYNIESHVNLIQECSPKAAYDERIPEEIDLLFIDGDHRTSHTLTDFIAFIPKLRVGGIYVQHDWCGRASNHYPIPVKDMVQRSIAIILQEFPGVFDKVGVSEGSDRGAIALKKVDEMRMNIR